MLKTIAFVVIMAVAGLLGFAATRPDTFRVQRQASIQAPPEKIFAYIDDFHRWGAWSPYEKLDPTMKRDFSGAARGQGAVYAWSGEGKAGAGRMEIREAAAPRKVLIQLDFSKPFKASNTAEFSLEPDGNATRVTWAMYGPAPFVSKLMQVFFSMDGLVGQDFETGLANLKALAEK